MQPRTELAIESGRDPDFVSPKNQKQCCGDEVAVSSKRFLKMSESEIASISKLFVAVNTKKNTDWALTVFWEWRRGRNAMLSEGEHQCQSDLLEKADVEELNHWLSRFVGEIEKNGKPY